MGSRDNPVNYLRGYLVCVMGHRVPVAFRDPGSRLTILTRRKKAMFKIYIKFGKEVRECHVLNNSIQHNIEFTVGFFAADGSHHSRLVKRSQIVYQ